MCIKIHAIRKHTFISLVLLFYIILLIIGKDAWARFERSYPFLLNGLLIVLFAQILLKLPIQTKRIKWPTLLQCIFALLLILILRKMHFLIGFSFANLLQNSKLALALEYLTSSILFILFIIFVTRKVIVDLSMAHLKPQVKIMINYFLAFLIIHINLLFIKNVIVNTQPLSSPLAFLDNWPIHFLSIAAIDISLLATFYMILELFKKYHVRKMHGQKLVYFLLAFLLSIPLQSVLQLRIPLVGFFLGLVVLFILFDIFLDQKYRDLTWGFIWIFVMSIHVSSLLVFFNPDLTNSIPDINTLNIYALVSIITILTLSIAYCFNLFLAKHPRYPIKYSLSQLSFRNKILTLNLSIVIIMIMSVIIACFLIRDALDPNLYFLFNRIFVVVLLATLILSLIANGHLTRPFIEIKHYISELGLKKKNRAIEWTSSKDEIYDLVTAYNRAIIELEEGASNLARTERETAWKEMAKQVAHEIKNPLTPMKLSLQYLQNRIKKCDDPDAIDLVDKASKTLIAQIDNLTRIANSFSSFSRLPKPQMEKVVLNELLANVHNLFNNLENIHLNLYVPIDDIEVTADKHQMIQVLNNLVKNAIQALNDANIMDGNINIRLNRNKNNAVIQVEDNGPGISEDVRGKVFSPNFTTKNSGTGLGLAICHKIIESHEGKIYFDTEEGKGTVFFVILKVA